LFDGATMIRTLHHMAEAPRALAQVRRTLEPNAIFVLEYANKLNLKAILRYWLGRQSWSPFSLEPIEFAALNFDFHPDAIRKWLVELGFEIQKVLAVSHFRIGFLKRLFPAGFLAALDGLVQPTGAFWQLSPSIFLRARVTPQQSLNHFGSTPEDVLDFFRCPDCGTHPLQNKGEYLLCGGCGKKWAVRDGIYDFREALE